MVSVYDVTIKLYRHRVIERHMHAVDAINDAINVLDVFCSCCTVILAVSQT